MPTPEILALFKKWGLGHQPSKYRAVHQHAREGNVAGLNGELLESLDNLELPDDSGATPLILAAHRNHIRAVEFLLSRGANIHALNSTGATALHLAAQEGHDEMCSLLIRRGASPHLMDNQGRTPRARRRQWGNSPLNSIR